MGAFHLGKSFNMPILVQIKITTSHGFMLIIIHSIVFPV